MSQQPETPLRKRIQTAIGKEFPGSRSFKIHGNPYQEAGIPDLLCCVDGIFIGLEVKRDGKDGEAIQASVGRTIRRAGGFFSVVHSPEEAIEFINYALTVSLIKSGT